MKKIFTAILVALTLVSCGGEKKSENTLYVYSWAEYIPQEIYEKFQAETGIMVVEDIYSSNEEMYAKVKAGATGYDLLIPSADYSEILFRDGLLQKFDKSKISTLNNIDPMVLDKLKYFDSNNDIAIPYAMGATGIMVNKNHVKDYPRDFSIYLRDDLKGKMTLLDDMREVFTSALLTLGYKANTTNEAEIKEAAELIKRWKKNIVKFDADSFGKGFVAEEFYVVHGYADNVFRELEGSDSSYVDFIIPEKGAVAFIDSFVLTKDSKNVENAHKFVEFIHKPENYALMADINLIPSINVPAKDLMEVKPVYQIEDLKNSEILGDIGDALSIQSKYWQEILIAE